MTVRVWAGRTREPGRTPPSAARPPAAGAHGWMRPAAFSPRLRECHALAGELGALRPIETTGFAVAADGPRTVADARGLACKVSPGGSVQCVGRQVVRTGERAGTPEVCSAERVGFVPGEPAAINNERQVPIPQITRSAQNLSIRYKTGTQEESSRGCLSAQEYGLESRSVA